MKNMTPHRQLMRSRARLWRVDPDPKWREVWLGYAIAERDAPQHQTNSAHSSCHNRGN